MPHECKIMIRAVYGDAFVSLRAVRQTCKCHRGFLVEFASSYYPVWSLNSSFYFVLCFPPFPRSRQFLTRVKRTMDVVPVHICVSSITTAQPPAPVRTSWSFRPTNSPALVSGNTFSISSFFSLPPASISVIIITPVCENRKCTVPSDWLLNYLTSAEKVPPVCAAVRNPWRGHWRPLHERHDGSDGARYRRCHRGGLRFPGGEDLLGRHQNSNDQTSVHQRHPARDCHLFRWVDSRR